MRHTILLFVVLSMISFNGYAKPQAADSLTIILQSNAAQISKQKSLAFLFYNRFLFSSNFDNTVSAIKTDLKAYDSPVEESLNALIDILVLRRKFMLVEAEEKLKPAIIAAQKRSEYFMLHQFYLNQAYVKTDLNYAFDAVYSYRLAKRTAERLADKQLVLTADIGISDIFTSIGLYPQALDYLDGAQRQAERSPETRSTTKTIIYLNKAEVFFRTGKLDSLQYYRKLVFRHGKGSISIDRNIKRLDYYELLLKKQYGLAERLIKELLQGNNRNYINVDKWYLAKSLYELKELDSAKKIVNELLSENQNGSSQIRLDCFKLRAKIAADQRQLTDSQNNIQLALAESEKLTQKLALIDDLSSGLRIDEVESINQARDLIYHRERTILIFSVFAAILLVLVIYMAYRNMKQKNQLQELVHKSKSQELAFINSHEVRRPLANILAICEILAESADKTPNDAQLLNYLDQEAKEMDQKLREVELKLREHNN